MRHAQHSRLIKVPAKNLQPNRKPFARLATWNRDSRNARQIRRHGVDVREIHRQRIIYFLSQLERRSWRSWSRDHIHFLESLIESRVKSVRTFCAFK